MPASEYYYPETTRNLIVALMDMFNNINVKRYEKDKTTVIKSFHVPLRFGPADSIFMTQKEHENCDKYYLTFPRMGLSWNSMDYASDRVYGADELRHHYDKEIGLQNMESFWEDVNPTPFDFGFTLHVRTNSFKDFVQIIEQIYPYFNPDLYLRIKEFSFLNLERDIQVTIGSMSPDFSTELSQDQKRRVNCDIPITCKAFLMRPLSNLKIIKEIKTRYYTDQINDDSIIAQIISSYDTSGAYETSAIPSASLWDYSTSAFDLDDLSVSAFINASNFQ